MRILFFLFLSFSVSSFAQMRQVLSQYMFHQQTFNPGYSDPDTKFSVNGIYKRQWVTQNNFPESGIIYGHYNIDESQGAGLMISNDLMNNVNQFEAALNYVYKIPVFYEATLGIGLKLALCEQNLINKSLIYFDPEPLLAPSQLSFTYFNAGAGISLTSPRFNFHLSAPYFFGNTYLNATDVYSIRGNHLYMFLGYKYRPRDEWFMVYPTALVTALEGAQLHGKFNLNFLMSQLVWAGLGISTDLTLNFTAGIFSMGGLRVLYGFDTSFLTKHSSTGITHEVTLNYAKTINDNPFHRKKGRGLTSGGRRRR